MRKINLIFCALLFAVFSTYAQNQTTFVDSIRSGGIYRHYRLYVPKEYNSQKASALIIDMHGYTSNAYQEQLYSNFMPVADTANFLVAYPDGTKYNGTGPQFWNAGISSGLVNDVGFISDLIDQIFTQYNIDVNSVYACGMSNGGFMSHTLACALNNKIAAIASVTGSMFTTQYMSCKPARVVPVMQIHGTADKTVPYIGNSAMMNIDTLVSYWVRTDKCHPTPVVDTLPDNDKADSCRAIHYVYEGGEKEATCEFYKIVGGEHTWPGAPIKIGVTNNDFNATEKIWLFFRKYKLNNMVGINELKPWDETRMDIYPNPCLDHLTVEGETIRLITIVDMNGKVVLSTNSKHIDVSALDKGIYSVILTSKKQQLVVRKLVKL